MLKRIFLASVLIAAAVTAASCGKPDAGKASGQIAAKVNGEEISVHQINSAIAGGNAVASEPFKQAAARVLERIIDEELLVQQAFAAKLDRDPQVMRAIEGAKRRILAQAYIDRAATAAPSENPEDIGKFYRENPGLFERRRIYRVHELVVVAPQDRLVALNAAAAGAKDLEEVAGWLKSQSLPFNAAVSSKPAEQFPMNVLPRMLGMHEGQIAVVPTPFGASVMQLLKAEDFPLSEQQAVPVIERYLHGRRRLELARAEAGKLREIAKIEYVGEFEAARPAAATHPGASSPSGDARDREHARKGLAQTR